MKQVFAICLFAAAMVTVGCGNPQPTSVIEDADRSAIEAYEAAVAADDAAADATPPDTEASAEATE